MITPGLRFQIPLGLLPSAKLHQSRGGVLFAIFRPRVQQINNPIRRVWNKLAHAEADAVAEAQVAKHDSIANVRQLLDVGLGVTCTFARARGDGAHMQIR